MGHYRIEPERSTLHGQFSPDFPPVLTINSGDTVCYRTLDVAWGLEQHKGIGVPRQRFEPREPGRDDGPALCGPVAIRGAEPGMTLAIKIEAVQPAAWGWTMAGGAPTEFNKQLGVVDIPTRLFLWELDTEKMLGRNQYGHTVHLRPFVGTIGMPPAESGLHSGWLPRVCGGNMDCKELVAGTTLYLPIQVPGGLVSLGDGHGVQADGEVCGMAIECPMANVALTFTVVPDLTIPGPRANTPTGWVTLGFDEDLHTAMYRALNHMLDLMQAQYKLGRADALALASLHVDVRITQIVNRGIRGVHAFLPHQALH